MPIGARNPTDPPTPVAYGTVSPAAAGVLQGPPASSTVTGTRWFRRLLAPQTRTLSLAGTTIPLNMGVLDAPGPGTTYLVERITVLLSAGNSTLAVFAGIDATQANMVDGDFGPLGQGVYTSADVQPIRLGAGDQLYVAAFDTGTGTSTFTQAVVQVRTEAAS